MRGDVMAAGLLPVMLSAAASRRERGQRRTSATCAVHGFFVPLRMTIGVLLATVLRFVILSAAGVATRTRPVKDLCNLRSAGVLRSAQNDNCVLLLRCCVLSS